MFLFITAPPSKALYLAAASSDSRSGADRAAPWGAGFCSVGSFDLPTIPMDAEFGYLGTALAYEAAPLRLLSYAYRVLSKSSLGFFSFGG